MYGTAPPPKRVVLLVIPGAMDPRSVQTRSENASNLGQKHSSRCVLIYLGINKTIVLLFIEVN